MEYLILEKFNSQEIIEFGMSQATNIMNCCGDMFSIAAMILIVCIIVGIIALCSDKFNHWLTVTGPEFVCIAYVTVFGISIIISLFSGLWYFTVQNDYNKMLDSPEPVAVTTALKYWES